MPASTDSSIKLQVALAHQGIASRRKAEELIAAGHVAVNGVTAHIGQRITPGKDNIEVRGQSLSTQEARARYFLVNKPKGLISTTSDELNRETVLTLIPNISERLYPVGRLDKDSEGLLLLTNDGDLAYMLTHPKHEIKKTYRVRVDLEPTILALDHLRRGVKLDLGYTKPADVEITSSDAQGTWLEIVIHEGKQHQVRRMMRRVGYEVERLIRVSMGPLNLKMLHGKRYRELSTQEIEHLFPNVRESGHGDQHAYFSSAEHEIE